MEKNIGEIEEIIDEWFKTHNISLLNIYILSLMIIEHVHFENMEKQKMIPEFINFILDVLSEKIDKEEILNKMNEEKETLEEVGKIMIEICNNPNLLQKDKFNLNQIETKKVIICRPESRSKFSFGLIKN
jgi:K+/H+ antiporter YhaU regulatory subunit KhtT